MHKGLEMAKIARKPKILFSNQDYMIEKIPLNFRITISKKWICKPNTGMERDWYAQTLEKAHKMAQHALQYFVIMSDKQRLAFKKQ